MALFYVFGAVAVVASLLVIGQRNPIYSVLLLIASFGALVEVLDPPDVRARLGEIGRELSGLYDAPGPGATSGARRG